MREIYNSALHNAVIEELRGIEDGFLTPYACIMDNTRGNIGPVNTYLLEELDKLDWDMISRNEMSTMWQRIWPCGATNKRG